MQAVVTVTFLIGIITDCIQNFEDFDFGSPVDSQIMLGFFFWLIIQYQLESIIMQFIYLS